MYEEWPLLEFRSLQNESTLSLFSKDAGKDVAEVLMREIVVHAEKNKDAEDCWDVETEEQLSWLMHVVSYALTLSYAPVKEYEALKGAVRTYVIWLSALLNDPHPNLPKPLRADPRKYTSELLNSLGLVFARRTILVNSSSSSSTVEGDTLIARQAHEMHIVLKAVTMLNANATSQHKDHVWAKSLHFLLNVADSLLAGQSNRDDISAVMAPNMIQTLFDEFLKAARAELIPSPSYWRTLSVVCRRWRHEVSLIESWARKVLSLSVLIVREMYGNDYCAAHIVDEEVRKFSTLIGRKSEDESYSILHVCWFEMLHLLGNPATIVHFDPCAVGAVSHNPIQALLATGGKMDSDGRPLVTGLGDQMSAYTVGKLRQCFFMACAAVAKLVDVFYGDSRVSMHFEEGDKLMHQWADRSRAIYDEWLKQQQVLQRSSSGSVGAGDNGTLTANTQPLTGSVGSAGGNMLKSAFGLQGSSHSSKSRANSERSLPQNMPTWSYGMSSSSDLPPEIAKPSSSQFVWHYLRSNPMYQPHIGEVQPKVSRMLDMFMDWLVQSALVRPTTRYRASEGALSDVGSERSMSSVGVDEAQFEQGTLSGPDGGLTSASESVVTRKSFAQSIASSSDTHSVAMTTILEWPGVDGVGAGRASAIAALCRIVCSKRTNETLADSQLAHFYKVLHEALLEKDRLILCSVIYYGGNMFRLGLKGVEVLLPLFVVALDIVLIESTKIRLHPSISEVDMRRACLRALSSIITWPTMFGSARIADPSHVSFNSSGYNIPEEHSTAYIELRPRIHRNLIHSLRHETDPTNLHLTLAMCNILCEESCVYDLCCAEERVLRELEATRKGAENEDDKGYCVSVLRSVVSAICDNLCKPGWSCELSVCLAAIDCLNSITNIHPSMLFHKRDLSLGFLVVTSLCRFIDTQLMKPPPQHSRDLHSSVVAAYMSLAVWLCAAPLLVETESCLTTVAESIEFGVYGGKNLALSERKAASKRVHDAAQFLLYNMFTEVGRHEGNEIIDERRLLYRYGPQAIDTTKFRHFLIKQETLLSIHEATRLTSISEGDPSLLYVVRTPHHTATATMSRLCAKPDKSEDNGGGSSRNSLSVNNENKAIAPQAMESQKPFEIPAEVCKPTCKLDSVIPVLNPTPETDKIITELSDIKRQMHRSESNIRAADERNIWLREPLASQLAKPIQPTPAAKDCDAGRVFLYDMGLISEEAFIAGDIVMLDSARSDEFYQDLHQMVDRCPSKLIQSVCIFYVRNGQCAAADILANSMKVETTSNEFCALLAELGEGVAVASHPHWTGSWNTAFSSERKPIDDRGDTNESYILDGITHCLWWSDAHVEVAYTMPTLRCKTTDLNTSNNEVVVGAIVEEHFDTQGGTSRLQRAVNQYSSSGDEHSTGRASGSSARSSGGVINVPRSKSTSANVSAGESNPSNGSIGFGDRSLVKRSSDQRVFVVWLECYEDMRHFPADEMFSVSGEGGMNTSGRRPDSVLIFLHQLEPGLIRVHVQGDWTKCGLPGPLVDGCVVSENVLPSLLRLTVISIARRKTVELENYQMVYCRRRMAIQDFARKYEVRQNYGDLMEKLIVS